MALANAASESELMRGVEKLASSLDEIVDLHSSMQMLSSQERPLPPPFDVSAAKCVGPKHPQPAFDWLVMQFDMFNGN
ncbi:hypothetical protein Pyn_20592 [Prunus yedoensis var. nudiflora]|uniref:Uncharacterized protein n=1 Tax=Prunus yedoensis var. nudiflora TaxID=2094558 RepID=A0A314UVM4_PRUYE|nr:hypothetical protein Pyn_20590 [Prunus yedoensis var. nudiflora]PQM41441.1 hypothetical protein Pyn_20592 [Prunus yedoensis var. nudiflora]